MIGAALQFLLASAIVLVGVCLLMLAVSVVKGAKRGLDEWEADR